MSGGATKGSPGCPVCGSAKTETFLRRDGTPLHQNVVMPSQAEATAAPRGDLAMCLCPQCGFVFNSAFDDGRVYFETPDVTWILRNQVIWDFFYEHCSLFAPGSLSTAFAAAGFRVSAVRRVFCDQYLWIEASVSDGGEPIVRDAGPIPDLAR